MYQSLRDRQYLRFAPFDCEFQIMVGLFFQNTYSHHQSLTSGVPREAVLGTKGAVYWQ